MKIKELKKKEALCEIINMKFDEANELFEAETLQSMQMAQISGGTTGGPIAIGKGVAKTVLLVSELIDLWDDFVKICNIWKEGGTTPPGNATVTVITDDKNGVSFTLSGRADSIIVTKDAIKIYGPSDVPPTSITNSNSGGSTDMP